MRTASAALAICVASATASASDVAGTEARMNSYFRLWETNSGISRANVQNVYAHRVDYYGNGMSQEGVYQAKQSLARQWPNRKYSVVPGTITKSCQGDRCRVDLVLSWKVSDAGSRRGTTGATTVSLVFVREDGELKIARETGTPVARSLCRNPGDGWDCYHQNFGRMSSR